MYLVVRGEAWEGYKVRSVHRSLAGAEKSKARIMAEQDIDETGEVDYVHIVISEVED